MSKTKERRQILQINNDLNIIYVGEDEHPGVLHSIEAIVKQCEGQTAAKREICRILMKHSGVSFDPEQQHAITSEFIIAYFGAFLKKTLDGQPPGTGPVETNNDVAVRQIRDKLILIYQEVKNMYDELVRSSRARAPRAASNAWLSQIEMAREDAIALSESRARQAAARAARALIPRVCAHAGAGPASFQPSFQQPSPFPQPVFRQPSSLHFPTAAMQEQMDTEQIREHFEQRRRNIEDQHRLVGNPHVAEFLDSIFIPSDDDYEPFDAAHNDPFAVVNYPKFALQHDHESANFDEQYALRLAAERRKYRDPSAQIFQPATSMQY